MQGNVVSAAKWLGALIIVGSVVLALGVHSALSIHTTRLTEAIRSQTPKPEREALERVGQGMVANPDEPQTRLEQMINQSEDFGPIDGKWPRVWWRGWFDYQPWKLTPERMHGGIQ